MNDWSNLLPGDPYLVPLYSRYAGMKIISDRNMGDRKLRVRERTWKERLFTLPWQPMKKLAFYTIIVPNGEFYLVGGRIIGHPKDIQELERAIEGST